MFFRSTSQLLLSTVFLTSMLAASVFASDELPEVYSYQKPSSAHQSAEESTYLQSVATDNERKKRLNISVNKTSANPSNGSFREYNYSNKTTSAAEDAGLVSGDLGTFTFIMHGGTEQMRALVRSYAKLLSKKAKIDIAYITAPDPDGNSMTASLDLVTDQGIQCTLPARSDYLNEFKHAMVRHAKAAYKNQCDYELLQK